MAITTKKIALLKQEYMAITHDMLAAIILNQFVYWAKIKMQADAMYEREFNIYERNGTPVNFKPSYGWIYKTADELNEEVMAEASRQSIRRRIKFLVDAGFISERKNPNISWDHTTQYHVNLYAINKAVCAVGLYMDEFVFDDGVEHTNVQIGRSDVQIGRPEDQVGRSDVQVGRTIPEITTEITTESTSEITNIYPDVQKPAVNNKNVSKQNEKIKYAEFVSMTQEEHDKLEEKYGPVALGEMIEKLDNYKGASGKRYKSDYRAILSWVAKSYAEEQKNAQNGFLRDNNPIAGIEGAIKILNGGGMFGLHGFDNN